MIGCLGASQFGNQDDTPYKNASSWRALALSDDELPDGEIAKRAVEVLEEIQGSQFFLAVGFKKPHMPLYAPAKYYELYDPQTFKNIPEVVLHPEHEIITFSDISSGGGPLSEEKTLELLRAYAASTSFIDAQVGRVLDQLDALGLTESTIVLLCGDHGFHLGEHGTWGKRTTYEVALRTPLVVSIPGQNTLGIKTDALVELVDIFPTLTDACQLPILPQLEGISMVPVIEQPTIPWKSAAFSKVGNEYGKRSIRTGRYRYTESGINASMGKELYDHNTDPDETVNIAYFPENAALVKYLSERLRAGWKAALPDVSNQIPVLQTLPWDINGNGIVDSHDLVLVSEKFGMEVPKHSKVDVNKDGRVDIIDLLTVAIHFGESINPAASATHPKIPPQHLHLMETWLTEARFANDGSHVFLQGLVALESLLKNAMPEKTALLPNYPNPFNPETWIPYDLAEDAEVQIHIYNLKRESIRQLSLGFRTAGPYRTRERAAYWDGRNAAGEPIASGIYFYTLQAGNVKATRQMVIIK